MSTLMWERQVRHAWAEGILTKKWGVGNAIWIWFRKQHGADYELTKED